MRTLFKRTRFDREASTVKDVYKTLHSLIDKLGIDFFAFTLVMPPNDGGLAGDPVALTNYPVEWTARYVTERYDHLDPVVDLAARSHRPFFWGGNRFLRQFQAQQRKVMDEAREFGLTEGFVIPVHCPSRPSALFCLAKKEGERLKSIVDQHASLLIAAAHDTYEFMVHPLNADGIAAASPNGEGSAAEPVNLTVRETQCLLWTGEGKTAAEIGSALKISKFTVNRHLSNAQRKMGCANKCQAVYQALLQGMIRPVPRPISFR